MNSTKNLTNYCKVKAIMVIISIFFFSKLYGQEAPWEDIELIDTIRYTAYSNCPTDDAAYPPSNLFDADFSTCWVAGNTTDNPHLFVKLPKQFNMINIFTGYGKNEALYYKNARPSIIKTSLYGGINPEGYVSEISTRYKSILLKENKLIHLSDLYNVQHIPFKYSKQQLKKFEQELRLKFSAKYDLKINHFTFILKLEIIDNYKGTKYDDICISEIFFNDRLITKDKITSLNIKDIYIDDNENALYIKTEKNNKLLIYRDNSSVLQLIDISKNKEWAILISMPSEIKGRSETNYLLANLKHKKIMNQIVEEYTGDYKPGNEMYFKYDNNRLMLQYITSNSRTHTIELK